METATSIAIAARLVNAETVTAMETDVALVLGATAARRISAAAGQAVASAVRAITDKAAAHRVAAVGLELVRAAAAAAVALRAVAVRQYRAEAPN
jgi:hypothetical protein